jgi:SSS family transporter
MAAIDWIILALYFVGMIGLSLWIGRRQGSGDDYFLGGRKIGGCLIAMSLAANQVSAISLVGAPAFVALAGGGGLKWLQYEFAVPLAMIPIMFVIAPLLRGLSGATIYEYAERRFGLRVRLTLSAVFMVSRGLATGVVLYASALVLAVSLGIPLIWTLGLMGFVAIAYTTIGGITADILSDAIQLVILFGGTLAAVAVALTLVGGLDGALATLQSDAARLQTIDPAHHGLGDGVTYSLWPMLFGGFFLYISYYGCDQSQAQRLMSTPSLRAARNGLTLNGLIRFPVVLAYCLLGLLLAAFLIEDPAWASQFKGADPNYLVPVFIVDFLPAGITGLVMAGIFAATMSSIDSALNSLSAVTMTDFVARFKPAVLRDQRRFLFWSRTATLLWGAFCVAGGYFISTSHRTVIEIVNAIGSLFYGPILAVFFVGALLRRVNAAGALAGLAIGLGVNMSLWLFAPGVSWLWWNPIGFGAALASAYFTGFLLPPADDDRLEWLLSGLLKKTALETTWWRDNRTWIMAAMFVSIVLISALVGFIAQSCGR